jgi:CelD/BcsL family acetyltransferase involved in cellulose biosynthesis
MRRCSARKLDGASVGDTFKTEIIEDWETFTALESEWNGLLRNSKADIVFLTWEWIRSWVSVAGTSVKPLVVVVRNSRSELVGLAPFYFSEYRFLRSLRYRVLRPVADYATGAECLDWIVRGGEESRIYPLITEALAAVSGKWDCIWMPYVPDWTGASGRITTACRERGFSCHTRPTEFGYSVLPENFDRFLKALSRNRRSELRRHQKAVFNGGQAVITRCRSEEELNRYLDALFDLHHRRWKSRGEEGSFKRKPAEAAFYREFLPAALQNGWLWLYGLASAGEFKAVQVGYVYGGVFYQLQEGFDPDYINGAGNVLRAKIIEDCIAGGVKCYDFLGEMSEHKRRWAADIRLGRHLFIGNRNVRSRILFAKEIWPTGRYLRPSLLPTHVEPLT